MLTSASAPAEVGQVEARLELVAGAGRLRHVRTEAGHAVAVHVAKGCALTVERRVVVAGERLVRVAKS